MMNTFQRFVYDFGALLETQPAEAEILDRGAALLGDLIRYDPWLQPRFTVADADHYRQYLLHLDPQKRFSVVSFVWGPGRQTPVHDHTVWGLIGMLRGAEIEQRFKRLPDGSLVPDGEPQRLEAGQVGKISPANGDVHRVSNAFADRTSISIHVYAGDIGSTARSTYALDGTSKRFVSGYSNA